MIIFFLVELKSCQVIEEDYYKDYKIVIIFFGWTKVVSGNRRGCYVRFLTF